MFQTTDRVTVPRHESVPTGHWSRTRARTVSSQTCRGPSSQSVLQGPRSQLPCDVVRRVTHVGRFLHNEPLIVQGCPMDGRSHVAGKKCISPDSYFMENWSVTGDLQITWCRFNVTVQTERAN